MPPKRTGRSTSLRPGGRSASATRLNLGYADAVLAGARAASKSKVPRSILKEYPYKRTVPVVPGTMSAFKQRMFSKMVYNSSGGLTASTTQSSFGEDIDYYLNNIYTPKVDAPDFRVQGWDQLANIYAKYKVYGAKVDVLFHNCTLDGMLVAMRTNPSNETDFLTAETAQIAGLKKNTWIRSVENTGTQKVKLSKFFSIKNLEGLSKSQFNGDISLYNAAINGTPTRMPRVMIACCNTASTTASQIAYELKITYYTVFYDRKFLNPSTVV